MLKIFFKGPADGGSHKIAGNVGRPALLAFVFKLELSGDRRQCGVDIRYSRNEPGLTGSECATLAVRDDVFKSRYRKSLADTRAFVDALVCSRFKRDLLNRAHDEFGQLQPSSVTAQPGFLSGDLNTLFHTCRIMSIDFGADPVFERSDDLPTRGVVFWISGKDEHHVERHPDRIALNLNITFLHDVEQTDLNLACKIREFVDRKDAAVCARQQPVMNRKLVRKQVSAARSFYRIQVADKIGDRDVRCRKLFNVAQLARHECNRRLITALLD